VILTDKKGETMYYFYKDQNNIHLDGEAESRYFDIELVYQHIHSKKFQNKYKKDIAFVMNALDGLTDKAGDPLYLHALRMASTLDFLGYDEEYVLVALFHDILEDGQNYDYKYLKNRLNDNYIALEQLTRDKNMTYKNYILHIEHDIALKVKEMDINDHLYHLENITKSLIKRYKNAQNILQSTSKQYEKNMRTK
tara:strand:+ start:26478 stop:27062 length:585 start_codon:yes stop_codon:yes gene_type:complete